MEHPVAPHFALPTPNAARTLGMLAAFVAASTAGAQMMRDDAPMRAADEGAVVASFDERPPTAEELKFFESEIRPLLISHCYGCHSKSANLAKGGLRVDTRDALRSGGRSGPAVVPGDVDSSLLIRAVR